jgi:class 3 adenylate cyclase
MSLRQHLQETVHDVFFQEWTEREGRQIPEDSSVQLGNDAVKIDATVLYADMADSTHLVDNFRPFFAAEIYKSFLACAAKIIRSEGGEITAYDGDRVMAVFIGELKNTRAARTAMKIHWARREVIAPALVKQYEGTTFKLNHVVGIDTSSLFVAKTGVRGANDLVWVGRAANHAAKLSSLPHSHSSYISEDVYKALQPVLKVSADGRDMWEAVRWNGFDDRIIYRSNWRWAIA